MPRHTRLPFLGQLLPRRTRDLRATLRHVSRTSVKALPVTPCAETRPRRAGAGAREAALRRLPRPWPPTPAVGPGPARPPPSPGGPLWPEGPRWRPAGPGPKRAASNSHRDPTPAGRRGSRARRPRPRPAPRGVPRRGGAPQPASMRLVAPPDGAGRPARLRSLVGGQGPGRAARGMPGSTVPRAARPARRRARPAPADHTSQGAARERPRTTLPGAPRARSTARSRPCASEPRAQAAL